MFLNLEILRTDRVLIFLELIVSFEDTIVIGSQDFVGFVPGAEVFPILEVDILQPVDEVLSVRLHQLGPAHLLDLSLKETSHVYVVLVAGPHLVQGSLHVAEVSRLLPKRGHHGKHRLPRLLVKLLVHANAKQKSLEIKAGFYFPQNINLACMSFISSWEGF